MKAFGTVHVLINNAGILREYYCPCLRACRTFSIRRQIVQEYVRPGLGPSNRGAPKGCLLLYQGLLAFVQAAKGQLQLPKGAQTMTYSEKQFGRVVNTASAAGLYGNMGQANYSAAKSEISSVSVNLFLMTITIVGLIGFTRTLAREGTKYDIKANVIAPVSSHQTLYYTLILTFP